MKGGGGLRPAPFHAVLLGATASPPDKILRIQE